MKLAEVTTPQGLERNVPVVDRPSYKVFVDLDGVLVDFDKQMDKIGFPRHAVENDKKAKAKFWQTVGWMAKQGKPFWGTMDPMPDAHVLWNHINRFTHPEILSATGHVGNATEEKHDWVKRHLGVGIPTHLVRKSSDKAQFAAPNHILIDDRAKSIEPFVAAGGIGILHKSAADTIKKLEELGL
jgi:FMN phosphatase YigB (HAD superfamily)